MSVESLLVDIRKHLQARGARIADVVKEFNPKRLPTLPILQFERMLLSIGVYFTPQELAVLERDFETGDGMDVRTIIAAVEGTPEEPFIVEGCDDALIEIDRRLRERRQTVYEAMRQYDRARQGTVSKPDFMRALGNSAETVLLADKFVRPEDGLVHYHDVEQAIQRALRAPKKARSAPPRAFEKAAAQLIERNPDIHNMFNYRDRFNTGVLDEYLFETVLSAAGAKIAPEEMDQIVAFYKRDDGQVEYLRFVADYKEFAKARRIQLEQSPRQTVRYDVKRIVDRLQDDLYKRRVTMAELFDGQGDEMSRYIFVKTLIGAGLRVEQSEFDYLADAFEKRNGVIDLRAFLRQFPDRLPTFGGTDKYIGSPTGATEKVREFLERKKLVIGPRLQKYDRENKGEMPVDLVNSAVGILGLTLYPEEVEALAVAFPGSRKNFIRWQEFARAVDPPIPLTTVGDMITMSTPPRRPPPYSSISPVTGKPLQWGNDRSPQRRTGPVPDEIVTLLREINRQSKRQNLNLRDNFRMCDRTKSGILHRNVIVTEMKACFPNMAPQVIDRALDFYGETEINYYDFCSDIENSNEMNVTSKEELRRDLAAKLDPVLKRIKAFLVRNMISSKDIFKMQDTQGTGWIRTDRLQHCFSLLRLPLPREEEAILAQRFAAVEFPDRFEYRELCRMLDATQVESRDVEWYLEPEKAKANYEIFVNNTISCIREKTNARRRRIYDAFRNIRGDRITEQDFRDRLDSLNFLVTGEEIRALVWKYGDSAGIDWQRFCDEVNNAHLL